MPIAGGGTGASGSGPGSGTGWDDKAPEEQMSLLEKWRRLTEAVASLAKDQAGYAADGVRDELARLEQEIPEEYRSSGFSSGLAADMQETAGSDYLGNEEVHGLVMGEDYVKFLNDDNTAYDLGPRTTYNERNRVLAEKDRLREQQQQPSNAAQQYYDAEIEMKEMVAQGTMTQEEMDRTLSELGNYVSRSGGW